VARVHAFNSPSYDYLNKKAIIISPTIISLIQDQVYKLNNFGIPSAFLGSAQVDKVEIEALKPDSKELLILVTPEWMAKP
jgi:superfamily II DNA helicase RecQ